MRIHIINLSVSLSALKSAWSLPISVHLRQQILYRHILRSNDQIKLCYSLEQPSALATVLDPEICCIQKEHKVKVLLLCTPRSVFQCPVSSILEILLWIYIANAEAARMAWHLEDLMRFSPDAQFVRWISDTRTYISRLGTAVCVPVLSHFPELEDPGAMPFRTLSVPAPANE